MNPSYDLSPPAVACSEILKSNPKFVSRYLPNIIPHLPSLDLSTWHSHANDFVALNYGRQKLTLTFWSVVNFPIFVFHCVETSFFCFSFDLIFTIIIVEIHPLYIRIRGFILFYTPKCIHTSVQNGMVLTTCFWCILYHTYSEELGPRPQTQVFTLTKQS